MGKEFLLFVLISSTKDLLGEEIKTLTFYKSHFISPAHLRCCSHCCSVPFFIDLLITQVGIWKTLIFLLSQDISPFDFLNAPRCLMVLIERIAQEILFYPRISSHFPRVNVISYSQKY